MKSACTSKVCVNVDYFAAHCILTLKPLLRCSVLPPQEQSVLMLRPSVRAASVKYLPYQR